MITVVVRVGSGRERKMMLVFLLVEHVSGENGMRDGLMDVKILLAVVMGYRRMHVEQWHHDHPQA